MKKSFVEALKEDSWDALRAAPKVDLHCHAYFSTRRHNLESRLGCRLESPPEKMDKLGGMIVYAMEVLDPHLRKPRDHRIRGGVCASRRDRGRCRYDGDKL